MQSDLLETRALVSLFSILFRQVGRQLVRGIFALEVKRGEMAHKVQASVGTPRCGLVEIFEALLPLAIIFFAPQGKGGARVNGSVCALHLAMRSGLR